MKHSKAYIIITGTFFLAMAFCFDALPRSTYSVLEKRELKTLPEFSLESLAEGNYTKGVSEWFSDTQPGRDFYMGISMILDKYQGISTGEDNITFIASDDPVPGAEEPVTPTDALLPEEPSEADVKIDSSILNAKAKIANAGIVIAGTGPNTRALMAYGASSSAGVCYAETANAYAAKFADSVNVYCMVIPTAIEFYCPAKVASHTKSQKAVADNIFAHLNPGVKKVDIFPALARHVSEPIYLRTDHHWAPLGAYYAAEEFAKVAGVPFEPLSSYEEKVIHRFVGTMYGYSRDISVKQNPEDFIYYVPKNVEYTTTYVNYYLDSTRTVRGEGRPVKGEYFFHYKDGSGMAYCTFMGGDSKLTVVRTSTHNGRRLVIFKDSFGNAIPSNLFYSFEEIHIIDARYNTKRMIKYVKDNKITDILFANNSFNAVNPTFKSWYLRYLR